MKHTTLFFILLFLISCMGQVASDIYLPALPIIRHAFDVSVHTIQLTLTLFMSGFAVSHLIYGPISDRFGRKKPLIAGILLCIVGTILCQFASSISPFTLGRLLQGLGCGATATLFRSILRDVYSGNRLAKTSSLLGIGRVFLLASSPLIGSYLLHLFNWRACFALVLVYSSLCLIGCLSILEETNQFIDSQKSGLRNVMNNSKIILTHPIFISYSICIMLTFGGILAWLTSLPILLQEVVGLSPVQFGWISAIAGLFFAVGGVINALLVERAGLDKMLTIGLLIMLLGGVVMLGFSWLGMMNTIVIMAPVIIYILGSSLIFANAYAGAFQPFPKVAGTAGALFGFLQTIGGAISSSLIALTHSYSQTPLATVLIISSLLALVIIRFAHHNYQNKTKTEARQLVL